MFCPMLRFHQFSSLIRHNHHCICHVYSACLHTKLVSSLRCSFVNAYLRITLTLFEIMFHLKHRLSPDKNTSKTLLSPVLSPLNFLLNPFHSFVMHAPKSIPFFYFHFLSTCQRSFFTVKPISVSKLVRQSRSNYLKSNCHFCLIHHNHFELDVLPFEIWKSNDIIQPKSNFFLICFAFGLLLLLSVVFPPSFDPMSIIRFMLRFYGFFFFFFFFESTSTFVSWFVFVLSRFCRSTGSTWTDLPVEKMPDPTRAYQTISLRTITVYRKSNPKKLKSEFVCTSVQSAEAFHLRSGPWFNSFVRFFFSSSSWSASAHWQIASAADKFIFAVSVRVLAFHLIRLDKRAFTHAQPA